MSTGRLHIGELARRTGLSPAVLRAWEQRYEVIEPDRSSGGTRLYSLADLARVEAMQARMDAGLSTAEAAAAVRAAGAGPTPTAASQPPALAGTTEPTELTVAAQALRAALIKLDRLRAERALDVLLRAFTFETVAQAVLLPYLVDVGGRWERGEASIAEEHLATNLFRARLLGLSPGVGAGVSGRAVLAAPPEERHDIALVVLGVALERRGWQVTLLGGDTPVATVADAARTVAADVVVLAAMAPHRLIDVEEPLRGLARERPVLVAGPGASRSLARSVGALWLGDDPISAAATLEQLIGPRRAGVDYSSGVLAGPRLGKHP